MHNIKLIRKDPEYFSKKLLDRNLPIDSKKILDLDKKNRELIQNMEKLEQEKKIISKSKDKSQFDKSKKLLSHLNEISIINFDHSDVVRHPLVSKIVKAYLKND